eukprot:gene10268-11170_t
MSVAWDPLPPRKKAKTTSTKLSDLLPTPQKSEEVLDIADRIAENIAARSKINRDQTTLESRDGVGTDNYEYLDHTADVQCHAWGKDMKDAFEHMAVCMLNYMTDVDLVEIDEAETQTIAVQGHDMESLLYNYMNELLFKFISDSFCAKKVDVIELERGEKFSVRARLHGDIYDPSKHSCGTEIKAITYSNMQIHEKEDRVDLFVIVDI